MLKDAKIVNGIWPRIKRCLCCSGWRSLVSSQPWLNSASALMFKLECWMADMRCAKVELWKKKSEKQSLSVKPDLEKVKSRQPRRSYLSCNCWNDMYYRGSGTHYLYCSRKSTCFCLRFLSAIRSIKTKLSAALALSWKPHHLYQARARVEWCENIIFIQLKWIKIAFISAVMKFNRLA